MPFANISTVISQRIFEIKELRKASTAKDVTLAAKRAIRGHVYISLYGMYERVVSDCILTAIDLMNRHAIPISALKTGVQLFALHPDLASYRDVGNDKIWQRGLSLFRRIDSVDVLKSEYVFPADGSFMRPSQLTLIWELFDLSGDPWPDPRLIGRIHELVEARNHISHGTETPGQRGGRLSDAEMDDRISDIEALCVHIVNAFASHLSSAAGFKR